MTSDGPQAAFEASTDSSRWTPTAPRSPEQSAGRDALWALWTGGERLAYGCGYRDARAAVLADLWAKVEALPEPTLGLKGGVNRAAVLALLREDWS